MNDKTYTSSKTASQKTLVKLTLVSLFAALIAAGTFVSIPIPGTPVTILLQNMFVLLAGLILGPVLGGASALLYLTAGIIGAPVFPRANAGIAFLQGVTGGFIMGYPLMAFATGIVAGQPRSDRKTPVWRIALAAALGILIVYVPGVTWFKIAMNDTWQGAIVKAFLPFIGIDAVKAVVSVFIAPRLRLAVSDHLNG